MASHPKFVFTPTLIFCSPISPNNCGAKSSIKTKTVLTMTGITESTELPDYNRQKNGYKVTVKIFLCIGIVFILTRTQSPEKFTC